MSRCHLPTATAAKLSPLSSHHPPGALGVLPGGSHCGDAVTAPFSGIPQTSSQRQGSVPGHIWKGCKGCGGLCAVVPCPDQEMGRGQVSKAWQEMGWPWWDGWLGGGAKWISGDKPFLRELFLTSSAARHGWICTALDTPAQAAPPPAWGCSLVQALLGDLSRSPQHLQSLSLAAPLSTGVGDSAHIGDTVTTLGSGHLCPCPASGPAVPSPVWGLCAPICPLHSLPWHIREGETESAVSQR